MNIKTLRILIIFLLITLPLTSAAQQNEIFNSRIASLQVVAGDDWLSPPVIPLHGNTAINISFDDLTHEYHRYIYRIEHCDADWTTSSSLFSSEYVEGFSDGIALEDLEESLNTNVLYTHYRLQIPNSNCRLKMSGNYRVIIYDENNGEEPILSACFMVVEPLMGVMMSVTANTDLGINSQWQQVGLEVKYGPLSVTRPDQQLHIVIMQNGRWDDARMGATPQYTMPTGLKWSHNRQFIFSAGNEYRKFEMLDTDHPTLGIDKMRWDGTAYHAYLWPDEPRTNYIYDEDANGAFYIRNSDNYENNRLSDYVLVHFTLKSPRLDGEVYLNGVWTNDRFLPEYKLEYDELAGEYTTVQNLKLGYYNYQYLLVKADGSIVPVPSEGSFYQTENKYQAFIYYRDISGRSDRLVGYQQVSFAP